MGKKYIDYAIRILNEIGIKAGPECISDTPVRNIVQTKDYTLHGVVISVKVTDFVNTLSGKIDECKIEVDFTLPEGGVLANAYMKHCGEIEKIPKNQGHKYSHGPQYNSYSAYLNGKNTEAYAPWNLRYFVVESGNYKNSEIEEAVENAIALAKKFTAHLQDLPSLRYWKPTDKEVVAKAKEIVTNASLQETDCDREARAHWIKDMNSFFKGWFYPFNDNGRGTFDNIWPSSLEYAASMVGIEGSFEYAVTCLLLEDKEFIAKAREACRIRKEKITIQY